jgi:hypothetical protein
MKLAARNYILCEKEHQALASVLDEEYKNSGKAIFYEDLK